MRYHPATHDPVLKHLFQCQMSDEQIAERMHMGWQTIRRQRERLGLGMPQERGQYSKPPSESIPPNAPEPTSPVQIAKMTLGDRITERNGGYVLDQRTPISTPDMVREANRVRKRKGLDQFGPVGWRVKP